MLRQYITALFHYAGTKAWLSLGMTVFIGLTQGIGLVMIIPFLSIIGIGGSDNSNTIVKGTAYVINAVGIPANIYSVLAIYLILISVHAVITRYYEVLNTRIVNGFTQHLRNTLYELFCHVDWLTFLRTRNSDITHLLTADLQRVSFATQQLFQLIGAAVIMMIHIGVACIISVPMTLAALFCGACFMLILHPFNRKVTTFGASFRKSMDDMYSAVTQHLSGMKVARAYSLEERHKRHFRHITDNITRQMIRFSEINSATRMVYHIGATVILALFLLIGIEIVRISAVNLIVIVFLFARILPGFSRLQQNLQRVLNALPSFKAVTDTKQRFHAAQEPQIPFAGKHLPHYSLKQEIRFERVCFRYQTTQTEWVLENIDAVIPANTMTAITGPSGAGKSTMADLLLGLLVPDSGKILIDGHALSGSMLYRWRKTVGYVPQESFLFHESIGDNLRRAAPRATEKQLWEALRTASAADVVAGLPQQLDCIVGERGIRLSGGERQRIALARALLRSPSLLLLDEATSALDNVNERHIQNAIEALSGKLTVIVIAHRLSTIEKADYRIILDRGTIMSAALRHRTGTEDRVRSSLSSNTITVL